MLVNVELHQCILKTNDSTVTQEKKLKTAAKKLQKKLQTHC